jgi:hypothetical protein
MMGCLEQPGPKFRTHTRSLTSIDNEQRRVDLGARAVRLGIVSNLVTHARSQHKYAPVFEFSLEFARNTQQNMPFTAPVIGKITSRVFDQPHPNASKISSSPESRARDARVFGGGNGCPIGCAEGDVGHVHGSSVPF